MLPTNSNWRLHARQRLRSAVASSLVVPRTRLATVEDLVFSAAAVLAWNSPSQHVSSASSLSLLRVRLKTNLFSPSFLVIINVKKLSFCNNV